MLERRLRRRLLVLALGAGGCGAPAPTGMAAEAVAPEAARLEAAAAALSRLELGAARGYLRDALAGARDTEAAMAGARRAGLALWREEREQVQAGGLDDRRLYWRRLAALDGYGSACSPPVRCANVLQTFERAARGISDISVDSGVRNWVMVTGFDPFNLDARIEQSNPSGLAALWLDGRTVAGGDRRVEVQAIVLPVRFADFDAGLVEDLLAPLLEDHRLSLLLTVSMGRDAFDLERFPGRRRSARAADNAGVVTGASDSEPQIPRLGDGLLPGPEFVEFSLPVRAMLSVQRPFPVRDNRTVTTLERGRVDVRSLAELADLTAVSGSGGGYLSNEVSFRSVRLVQALGRRVAVGHLHTPRLEGHDAAVAAAIIEQTVALLDAAVGDL